MSPTMARMRNNMQILWKEYWDQDNLCSGFLVGAWIFAGLRNFGKIWALECARRTGRIRKGIPLWVGPGPKPGVHAIQRYSAFSIRISKLSVAKPEKNLNVWTSRFAAYVCREANLLTQTLKGVGGWVKKTIMKTETQWRDFLCRNYEINLWRRRRNSSSPIPYGLREVIDYQRQRLVPPDEPFELIAE